MSLIAQDDLLWSNGWFYWIQEAKMYRKWGITLYFDNIGKFSKWRHGGHLGFEPVKMCTIFQPSNQIKFILQGLSLVQVPKYIVLSEMYTAFQVRPRINSRFWPFGKNDPKIILNLFLWNSYSKNIEFTLSIVSMRNNKFGK